MAGVTPPTKPNRQQRRAAAATAPVEPAIAASAERAAIEREPGSAIDPTTPPIVPPPADVPAVDAAVLPEPTLVARPDEPLPIVTASPVLAVEPSAVDVLQAEAKAERIAAGTELAAEFDGPHAAAAGQPTMTIEADATGARRALADVLDANAVAGIRQSSRDILGGEDPYGLGRQERDGFLVMTLDEIVHNLALLAERDPVGMDIVRTRFFDRREVTGHLLSAGVTVIEVVGPAQGRRRAGRSFGPEPRRFLASDLSAAEIDALRSDPLLAVGFSDMDAAEVDLEFGATMLPEEA